MSDKLRVDGAAGGQYVTADKLEPNPKSVTGPVAGGVRAGGTITCDGKGELVTRNYAKPFGRDCVNTHEDIHKRDWIGRFGPDLCKNVPADHLPTGGPNFREFMVDSECRAHKESKQCSEGKLQDAKARLEAAEEKLKHASGNRDVAAAQREVDAAKKDRDEYLRAIDIDVLNMWVKYRCNNR